MNKLHPRQALTPAYRRHNPLRKEANNFVAELKNCIKSIKLSEEKNESEEHIKEPIKKFLKNTFFADNLINTRDRIDMAIYLDKDSKSDIAVLIEAKRPTNKAEFPSINEATKEAKLNCKALQELLLYYLKERIDGENNNIKHLIATNGYEWFLFKAEDFYEFFYKDKALIKEYKEFRDGLKDSKKNELFYNEIAKKYIDKLEQKLPFVYLDFTNKDLDNIDDAELNNLYKIFSAVHLLGHSYGNDSNELNQDFYNELLHIMGLVEVKDKGKKLIQRKKTEDIDYGSLLENAIFFIEDKGLLEKIKSTENEDDKLFASALELVLGWTNRILFLKLLEAQLLSYNNNKKEFHFLNSDFISDYEELDELFFSVLAKKIEERHPRYKEKHKNIPYLNSSLFEKNQIEKEALTISRLRNDEMQIYSATVLKDRNGKRCKGKMKALDYLFKFLDAFDFATDSNDEISNAIEQKALISASVLGLIFEKINGYKEGSFFTPAYITMYMSRESIRRAVVQKFKDCENSDIDTFEDLKAYCYNYFKQDDKKRLNKIINELKICDPAVGSGHFLVSAMNEIIAIKSELGILIDKEGYSLKCNIYIDNDELHITDSAGTLFKYNPKNSESQKLQETLFHEKQTIIENCLFGVDINPNSVKICRLRLWIELLKNTYYKSKTLQELETLGELESRRELELQTLPNIDINIKTGNSLISRFDLDADISIALRKSKWTIESYQLAVNTYKNTTNKKEKEKLVQLIDSIKNDFSVEVSRDSKEQKQLTKLKEEHLLKYSTAKLIEQKYTKTEQAKLDKERKKLYEQITKLEAEIEDTKTNKIYRNAFEWRFEFPEVLDKDGKFLGFDVVIGNPPYIDSEYMKKFMENERIYITNNYNTTKGNWDIYIAFLELSLLLSKKNSFRTMIIPNKILSIDYAKTYRELINNDFSIYEIVDISQIKVFKKANVYPVILSIVDNAEKIKVLKNLKTGEKIYINKSKLLNWSLYLQEGLNIYKKLTKKFNSLSDIDDISVSSSATVSEAYELIEKIEDNVTNGLKIINTGTINPYSNSWGEVYMQYIKKKYLKPTISKNNIKIKQWTLKPKIILAGMVNKIEAFIDLKANYFPAKSTVIIYSENNNLSLKYLGTLLNSKLIRFIFKTANFTVGMSGGYMNVTKKNILQLPIPEISKQAQQPFIDKVNKILSIKEKDINADISKLEQEIDFMVYALYGLTDEEVGIVEGENK